MTIVELIEMLNQAPHAAKAYWQADSVGADAVEVGRVLITPDADGKVPAVIISAAPKK